MPQTIPMQVVQECLIHMWYISEDKLQYYCITDLDISLQMEWSSLILRMIGIPINTLPSVRDT